MAKGKVVEMLLSFLAAGREIVAQRGAGTVSCNVPVPLMEALCDGLCCLSRDV